MLSLLESLNNSFFDYSSLASKLWRELITQEKKDRKIWFDLENNDYIKDEKRIIVISQERWTHTKCKFACWLCQAGGDWEIPVYYFRCQLQKGYAAKKIKNEIKSLRPSFNGGMFVYIPTKKEGNYTLVPEKDGWRANHDDTYTKDVDPKNDKNICWKSLKEYLKSMVELEIERTTKY